MSTLIVLNSTPYGSSNSKDALDVALTMAAFEQQPSILLRGNGLHLLSFADETTTEFKNPKKILAGLSLYDIDRLYIEPNEYQHLSTLATQGLDIDLIQLTADELPTLYAAHQHVIVF